MTSGLDGLGDVKTEIGWHFELPAAGPLTLQARFRGGMSKDGGGSSATRASFSACTSYEASRASGGVCASDRTGLDLGTRIPAHLSADRAVIGTQRALHQLQACV